MKSFNQVILLGNTCTDTVLKDLPSGMKVVNLVVATNQSKKKKDSDEWETFSDFHYVSCWGAQAEFAANFIKKGSQVFIEGRLSVNSYEDKDGKKVRSVNISANTLNLLGQKKEAEVIAGQATLPVDKPPMNPDYKDF